MIHIHRIWIICGRSKIYWPHNPASHYWSAFTGPIIAAVKSVASIQNLKSEIENIEGFYGFFIRASKHVIAIVERLLPTAELQIMEPNIPYFWVEAVVELPYGAHPTACYPFYAYDRAHLAEYYRLAQAGPEAFRNYLNHYVFEPQNHMDYLERIGGAAKREVLESWQDLETI